MVLDAYFTYNCFSISICKSAMATFSHFELERKTITALESAILHKALQIGIVKSNDFSSVMVGLNAAQRTYQIRKIVGLNLLRPITENARQYTIGFSNSYLLRGVTKMLTTEGFISTALAG